MKRTTWAALAAALIVLACGAPAASADSIAYVNRRRQRLPLHPRRLAPVPGDHHRRLQRRLPGRRRHDDRAQGRPAAQARRATAQVLADFDTPVSDTRPAPAKTFYGPFDPAISPDGTKVAYTYYYMTQSQNPGCFPPTCVVAINEARHRLLVRRPPDRLGRAGPRLPLRLAPSVVGRQRHDDDLQPVAPAEPRHHPRPHLRRRQRPRQHGHELDVGHGRQEPARRRRRHHARQAQARLPVGRERLDAHRLLRPAPSRPPGRTATRTRTRSTSATATASPAGGAFGVPTFSPDGGAIAYHDGDGVHVAAVPAFGADCTLDGATADPAGRHPRRRRARLGPRRRPAAARPAPTHAERPHHERRAEARRSRSRSSARPGARA